MTASIQIPAQIPAQMPAQSPAQIAAPSELAPARRTAHEKAAQQAVKLMSRLGRPLTRDQAITTYGFARATNTITDAERNRRNATGPQLRTLISADLCRSLGVYPVALVEGTLRVNATRLLNDQTRARIRTATQTAGFEVTDIKQLPEDNATILKLLNEFESVSSEAVADHLIAMNVTVASGHELLGSDITKAINGIITEALQSRAADIHIEYDYENPMACWIRLRIDGDLYPQHIMAPAAMKPIFAALKTMADLDASNVERPQGGRLSIPWNGRNVDIRVATTRHDSGAQMVMRLLDPAGLLSLGVLFSHTPKVQESLEAYTRHQMKGQGILILSGPTGAGKSTTLYALLMSIDRLTRSVMTAEDPVEAKIPFVTQCPVRDADGRRFAELVRAFLRQDPDYIAIGETRDMQTAEALARAAETGHHCLTSVHAYNVSQSIERVCGMFPPAYKEIGSSIIAHSLAGVVNQRLVKTVCPSCRGYLAIEAAIDHLDKRTREQFACLPGLPDELPIARQVDCKVCHGTGYRGRVLAAESLFFPSSIEDRAAIAKLVVSGDHHEILQMDNVVYVDRVEATAPLLKAGMLDVKTFTDIIRDGRHITTQTKARPDAVHRA